MIKGSIKNFLKIDKTKIIIFVLVVILSYFSFIFSITLFTDIVGELFHFFISLVSAWPMLIFSNYDFLGFLGDIPAFIIFLCFNLIYLYVISCLIASCCHNCGAKLNSYNRGKTIKLVIVGIILIAISVLYLASYFIKDESRLYGRDSKRSSDIRQIGAAMGLIYKNDGQYPIVTITDGGIDQTSIEYYLEDLPLDPGTGKVKGCNDARIPYRGFDNTSDRTKFCIYACLTNGKFFAASHKGVKQLDKAPTNLDCWVMLDERKE